MRSDNPTEEETPPPKRLPPTVIALGWVSFLTDVASEMIYPLLPKYLTTVLGANKAAMGLIEGVAETTSALLRLPSGVLSDRLTRRKPLIFFGYGVAGIVRPLIGLAGSVWQVLGIRFFDRLGKGLRSAPRDALLADASPPGQRGRAFGFHRAMDHAGAALGPLLASAYLFWRPDGIQTLFLLAFVPGALVLLVLWLGIKEEPKPLKAIEPPQSAIGNQHSTFHHPPHPAAAPPPSPTRGEGLNSDSDAKKVPARSRWDLRAFDPRFGWFLASLLLFVLGNSTDMFLLVRIRELGLDDVYLPLLWSGFHVAKSGLNIVGGRLADRYEPRGLLLAGWLLYSLVYLGFGLAATWQQATALFLGYAVYYGLTEPAEKALVAHWSPQGVRGAGFGWFNLVVGVGSLPASFVFGWLYDHPSIGALGAFIFGASLSLAAVILLLATFVVRGEK